MYIYFLNKLFSFVWICQRNIIFINKNISPKISIPSNTIKPTHIHNHLFLTCNLIQIFEVFLTSFHTLFAFTLSATKILSLFIILERFLLLPFLIFVLPSEIISYSLVSPHSSLSAILKVQYVFNLLNFKSMYTVYIISNISS